LDGVALNNGDWTYSQNTLYHIFTTNSVIEAGTISTLGFEAVFNPRNANGIYTMTAQIVAGSGGEVRINNNSDAEKVFYFIN
jgi:hypothetical protein